MENTTKPIAAMLSAQLSADTTSAKIEVVESTAGSVETDS